jgi:hypothetical protein
LWRSYRSGRGGRRRVTSGALIALLRRPQEDSWIAGDPVENAVKANVEMVVKLRTATPLLAELVAPGSESGRRRLFARHGKVTWLPDTP